ncbi:MAG: hypothetical protein Q7R81_05335 [Candidatus Peregrinibacteria bacterium]|nr:hypothetical protein [Candidatus Peregrinibacteria bacterium]
MGTYTPADIMILLYIVVAVMLIIVLYHVLFIVWDLRKVMRRFDDISEQIESVIMKPISMADTILQWILEQVEHMKKKHHRKKHISSPEE